MAPHPPICKFFSRPKTTHHTVLWLFLGLLCCALVATVDSRAVVVAHRGHGCSLPLCDSTVPENSIEAFLKGIDLGVDRVELDTWLTADSQIVVVHGGDPLPFHGDLREYVVVKNQSGSVPQIENTHFNCLLKYPIKEPWAADPNRPSLSEYESVEYENEATPSRPLPLFADVLQAVCSSKTTIQLEMKGNKQELGPLLLDLIEKTGTTKCIHGFSSFYWGNSSLSDFKLYNGDITADLLFPVVQNRLGIPLFLLFNNNNNPTPPASVITQLVGRYHASGVHLKFSEFDLPNKPSVLDEAKSHGYAVMSWFPGHTNETEDQLQELIDRGVTEICTNRPWVLLKMLNANKSFTWRMVVVVACSVGAVLGAGLLLYVLCRRRADKLGDGRAPPDATGGSDYVSLE